MMTDSEFAILLSLYKFVVRLDDDDYAPYRIRQHAHVLRLELDLVSPALRERFPPPKPKPA